MARHHHLAARLVLLMTSIFAPAVAAVDADELLKKFEQQQLGQTPMRAEIDTTTEATTNAATAYQKWSVDLRSDGQRFETISRFTEGFPTADEARTAAYMNSFQVLIDGETLYRYDKPLTPGSLGTVALINDPDRIQRQRRYGDAAVLFGYFAKDQENLVAIMRKGSVSMSGGNAPDGTLCFILTSKTPEDGLYKVWIDAQSGSGIKRVQITKTAGERYVGRPLAGPTDAMPMKGSTPDPWPTSIAYVYDVWQFQEADGKLLPAKTNTSLTTTFPNGTWHSADAQGKWKIDLLPNFAELKAFRLDIADGAKAYLPGANADQRHIWQSGKIIPAPARPQK